MSKEGISVCIRVRSLIQREIDAGEVRGQDWVVEQNTIRNNSDGKKPMAFDRVFDDNASNTDVYDEVAAHIIDSALKGINGTILAYGQTSSGKTFTMTSVMQHAFDHIFKHVSEDKSRNYVIQASYAEVYNEVIIDLSNKNDKNLRIDDNAGTIVNLTRKSISCPNDLFDFLKAGAGNRHVNKTNMNAESSRSHSIFQVMIESSPAANLDGSSAPTHKSGRLISVINFVDLAGSERAKSTGAEGNVFKEGVQINASLSALGNVIRALSSGVRHIPYRESKLTQILRPSLGGNSRTTMICCVTPSRANIPETKSTLSFAYQAKSVVNTVGVNEIIDDRLMNEEIERLRGQINALTKHIDDMNMEQSTKLSKSTQEIEHLKSHNEQLSDQYNALVNDIKTTIDKEIDQYKQRERELLSHIDALQSKLDNSEQSSSHLEMEYESLMKEQEEIFQAKLAELDGKGETELQKLKDEMEQSRKELVDANQEQLNRAYRQQNDLLNELEDTQKLLEDERAVYTEQLSRMKSDYKQQIAELKDRIIQEEKRTLEYQSKVSILEHENEQKMKLIDDIRSSKEREMVATEDRIKLMAGDKDKIIATLESELNTLKTAKVQQQSIQESFQRQLKSLQNDLSMSRTEVTQLRTLITQKDEKIEQVKAEAETFIKRSREKMKEDGKAEIEKYKSKLEATLAMNEEDMKAERAKMDNFKKQVTEKVKGYKDQTDMLSRSKITLEQEIERMKSKNQRLQHDLHALTQKCQSHQAQKNALDEKIRELSSRVDEEYTLRKHHEERYTEIRREFDHLEVRFKKELEKVEDYHKREQLNLIRKVELLERELRDERDRVALESNRSLTLKAELDKAMQRNTQLSLSNATGGSSGLYDYSTQRSISTSTSGGNGNGIYEDDTYGDNSDDNVYSSSRTNASRYRSPFKSIINGFNSGSGSSMTDDIENTPPSSSSALKSSIRNPSSLSSMDQPLKVMVEPVRYKHSRLASRRHQSGFVGIFIFIWLCILLLLSLIK